MEKSSKNFIERAVLKSVSWHPQMIYQGNLIYYTPSFFEKIVLSKMDDTATAKNRKDLEKALKNPLVDSVFIDKNSNITTDFLLHLLDKNQMPKNIYCAFCP